MYIASPLGARTVVSGVWSRAAQFARVVGTTPDCFAMAERVHGSSSRSGTRSFTSHESHSFATHVNQYCVVMQMCEYV